MTEHSPQEVDTRTLIILAFSATAGVLVEFYDFSIFGFAAASVFPNPLRATGKQHTHRLILMRGNLLQTRQRIRVSPYEKNKRRGLRIRFRSSLFPFFQRSFVNA